MANDQQPKESPNVTQTDQSKERVDQREARPYSSGVGAEGLNGDEDAGAPAMSADETAAGQRKNAAGSTLPRQHTERKFGDTYTAQEDRSLVEVPGGEGAPQDPSSPEKISALPDDENAAAGANAAGDTGMGSASAGGTGPAGTNAAAGTRTPGSKQAIHDKESAGAKGLSGVSGGPTSTAASGGQDVGGRP